MSEWHRVTEVLPPLEQNVIILTRRGNIATNKMYIPTDCNGNLIDGRFPCWHGNHNLSNSIVAWMEIPDFKDIIK